MTKLFDKKVYKIPNKKIGLDSLKERALSLNLRDEEFSNNGKVSGTRYCYIEYEKYIKEACKDFLFHN
jgi:hypothetical protein